MTRQSFWQVATVLLVFGLVWSISSTAVGSSGLQITPTPMTGHGGHASDTTPRVTGIEGSVWVANEAGNSLTLIDASTNQVVTTLTGLAGPHNIQVAPDGSTVWAVSGHDALVVKIDAQRYTMVGTAPTGSHPAHVIVSPDGQRVYVTNSEDDSVTVIDANTLAIEATVQVGVYPHGLRSSPDGRWIYIANMNSDSVTVLDAQSNSVKTTIEVGDSPVQVGLPPDGAFAYVSLNGEDALAKIDTATHTVVAQVDVGDGPVQVYVTPDNRFVIVANQGTPDRPAHTISLVDIQTFTVVATVETGNGAHGVVVEPTGRYAYVTNLYDNTISVISISEQTLVATIASGASPNGISFSPLPPALIVDDEVALTPGESSESTTDHSAHPGGASTATPAPTDHTDHNAAPNTDPSAHHGPISSVGVPVASQTTGGQPLDYRLEDGVKVFELTAQPVLWSIHDDVQVTAWTYNGTVPGPMIRVTEGDTVRIIFKNELPEATTIHWHGVQVPIEMDGVPGVSQDPVEPGETFVYEFVAKPAGTFMYHSHHNSDTQIGLGLYAPFIIDPAVPTTPAPDVDYSLMLNEVRVVDGVTYPAMPMSAMEPNYFTFNGKVFPNTENLEVKVGQRVRIRIYNVGQFVHPVHLHGMSFRVVAIDGAVVPEDQQLSIDTVAVAPGQRFDIEFVPTAVGQWMLHCHISHHTVNGDMPGHGGMIMTVNVTE